AAGGHEPTVYLWDVKSGRDLGKLNDKLFQEKHDCGVFALAMSTDGKMLATTDNFGRVFFWDKTTGKLRAEFQAHQFRVTQVAFSSDGKFLLTKGASTAMVWDAHALLNAKPAGPPNNIKKQ